MLIDVPTPQTVNAPPAEPCVTRTLCLPGPAQDHPRRSFREGQKPGHPRRPTKANSATNQSGPLSRGARPSGQLRSRTSSRSSGASRPGRGSQDQQGETARRTEPARPRLQICPSGSSATDCSPSTTGAPRMKHSRTPQPRDHGSAVETRSPSRVLTQVTTAHRKSLTRIAMLLPRVARGLRTDEPAHDKSELPHPMHSPHYSRNRTRKVLDSDIGSQGRGA